MKKKKVSSEQDWQMDDGIEFVKAVAKKTRQSVAKKSRRAEQDEDGHEELNEELSAIADEELMEEQERDSDSDSDSDSNDEAHELDADSAELDELALSAEDSEHVEGVDGVFFNDESEEQDDFDSAADEESNDLSSEGDQSEGFADTNFSAEGTELEQFESAQIEDQFYVDETKLQAIVEAILFSTDKPVSLSVIRQAFKGTNIRTADIRHALKVLKQDLEQGPRGVMLEEINGGYQLRTKPEQADYLRRSVKARAFKLSGPALEVMSIVAYKQPITKAQIDEIRGVESGHLLRALMEKNLVMFGGKSDLPGKPMLYETTKRFLEIFSLRNIKELPSLHEIDQLIPEGIGEVEEPEQLEDLTENLSQTVGTTYSEGEDELLKISAELGEIATTSEFFEQEKQRQREQRDLERAQNIRDALAVGEAVDEKERKWLLRYEQALVDKQLQNEEVVYVLNEETDEKARADISEHLSENLTDSLVNDNPDELSADKSIDPV